MHITYMLVCIYTCSYTCRDAWLHIEIRVLYVYAHVCVHTHLQEQLHILLLYVHPHACIHVHVHVRIYIYMRNMIHICVCARACVCVCVCRSACLNRRTISTACALSSKQIEPQAQEEANLYAEKTFEESGFTFEKRNGSTRYSFSHIPRIAELKNEIKEIEAKSKQAFISVQKGILVADKDGLEIELPKVTYTKDSLIVKK